MAKNTRPGERAWATVRRTGGDYPWEVTLLPLVVNGCQAGSVVSPGYVRRSEDRLCEPHFQRSTALSGVRVYAQDYLGAGIVPTPQSR